MTNQHHASAPEALGLNRAFTGLALNQPHDLLWLDNLLDGRAAKTRIRTFVHSEFDLEEGATHYVYSHGAFATVRAECLNPPSSYVITAKMFAVIPGAGHVKGMSGIVISRIGWEGLFALGTAKADVGRLKYIDGCTDTLLVGPPKLGDPCLNQLFFPPGIDQTEHTHPSLRGGMVIAGRGRCVHRPSLDAPPEFVDLEPGMTWLIHTNGLHKFQTPYGEPLQVLAYHPDSDVGPNDEEHPMLNRTIVEGVSAADPSLAHLRTQ